MNIGIDARPLTKYKTGIGYYLDRLLYHILKNDKENNYFLFSDRKIDFEAESYNNLFKVEDKENKILKKTAWYMCKLPGLLAKNNIDKFWGTQHVLPLGLKNIKTLLTIHDLVAYELPQTMHLYNRVINKLFIPISIKRADKIIAVSYSTKNGIMKHFGSEIKENKIKVIYEDATVINVAYEEEKKFFHTRTEIKPKKYLLYLGTLEPRKNIMVLLKAFEDIASKSDLNLVLCGKIGWKSKGIISSLESHPYRDRIIYLNYVSDLEKSILMKNSFAFVFPSLYEGFGLPVVEAMKMGTLVLVSSSSSLEELVQEKELKFEKNSPHQLAEKINKLISDDIRYEQLRSYCTLRGKDFDWDSIAKEYISSFDQL